MFPETIEITVIQDDVDLAYDFKEDTLLADCCPLHNALNRHGHIGGIGVNGGQYVVHIWLGAKNCEYVFDEVGQQIGKSFDGHDDKKIEVPATVTLKRGGQHV